jgi:hypothetical protein
MRSVLRTAVAVAALVAASAVTAHAQMMGGLKVEEIRIDLLNFASISGQGSLVTAGIPGTVALGIYLNDKVAFEPTLSILNSAPDNQDATTVVSLGLMVPYYLAGDRGRNGLFIAPGLMITKITDVDALIDFGADIGYKKAMNDKVSWSGALQFQTGDSTDPDSMIGARFGLSVFWR